MLTKRSSSRIKNMRWDFRFAPAPQLSVKCHETENHQDTKAAKYFLCGGYIAEFCSLYGNAISIV